MQTKIGNVECTFHSKDRVSLRSEHLRRGVADYYFTGQAQFKNGEWVIPIQETYFRNNTNHKTYSDVPFKSKEGVCKIIETVFREWVLSKDVELTQAEYDYCKSLLIGKEETISELEQAIENTRTDILILNKKLVQLSDTIRQQLKLRNSDNG